MIATHGTYDPDDDATKTPANGYGDPEPCPVCGQDNDPSGPGCACYGIPSCGRCGAPCPDGIQPSGIGPCCWPSWHPSSADLAAFRYSLAYTPANILRAAMPTRAYDVPDDGGAWQSERRDGIGYRVALDRSYTIAPEILHPHSVARREASAMRSRASARIFGDDVTWPEQTTFAPTLPTLPCPVCGQDCPSYGCWTQER